MIKVASRVSTLKSSTIMEIAAKAQELKAKGFDVISLAAGEPDFDTPEEIQVACTKAMAAGFTRYTPAPGFLKLREVIAAKVTKENGFHVDPDEVIVTPGAKHSLYLALQCLVEEGDAVLIPTPAWVSYVPIVELTGASVIPLPLHAEDGYRINVERWKGMPIPPNARGIMLNSPNNPTGVTYTKEDLIKLVGWAMQRNLWIMSDEIYEKILYDGVSHVSTASLGPEVKSQTITISGFSKSYCMTGWRLGWTIGDKDFIKKMSALQSQANSHVPGFIQMAAIAAAELPNERVQAMVKEFDKRRQFVVSRLDALKDFCTYVRPTGAFYFFVDFSRWLNPRKMTDAEFCQQLLAKKYVGLVPGSAFGQDGTVRISYATSMGQLEKAFAGIESFLKTNG